LSCKDARDTQGRRQAGRWFPCVEIDLNLRCWPLRDTWELLVREAPLVGWF
jgi:hypothetical protein